MVLRLKYRLIFMCICFWVSSSTFSISAQALQDIYIAISPSGIMLAQAQGTRVVVTDIGTNIPLKTFTNLVRQFSAPSWSPNGTWLSIANGAEVEIWSNLSDATNAVFVSSYNMELLGAIQAMDWHPTDTRLAISNGEIIDIVETENSNRLFRLQHKGSVRQLDWSPDGQYLLATGLSSELIIWDATTGQVVYTLWNTANTEPIPEDRPVALSAMWKPDGTQIAWGSTDGTIRFWDVDFSGDFSESTDGDPRNLDADSDAILQVAWRPDGQYIASASNSGVVKVWNLTTRQVEQQFQTTSPVRSIAWLPDGSQLLYADRETGVNFGELMLGHSELRLHLRHVLAPPQ